MGFYANSATAGSNTTVNSIASAGTSDAANIDNLVRELAAQGRQFANDLGGNNTVGGTADAITITPSSGSPGAYYDGMLIGFIAGGDTTVTNPTGNVSSIGAKTIKKSVLGTETALAIGDIQSGGFYMWRYRSSWASAAGAWELLVNPLESTLLNALFGLSIGTEGQSLIASSTPAPAWANRVTAQTVQATTSGTAFDFTGIPASARLLCVLFSGVSLSGTDHILVQLGDAGGIETASYASNGAALLNSTTPFVGSSTSGFVVRDGDAANTISGVMVIANITGNTWVSGHFTGLGNLAGVGGGSKALSDVLTQVRVTRSGTDTFDAGVGVNLFYL